MADWSEVALQAFQERHPATPGRALVVGSKVYDEKLDRRSLYRDGYGVDLFAGLGVDLVHDLEHPLPKSAGRFDHVDCVSVLEHVARPWKMAENIEAVMKDEATILVCVPFSWRVHAYPEDYWRMTAEALTVLFPSIHWLERKYLVQGRPRKVVPGGKGKSGAWIARSELVAAGVKCR